MTLTTQFDASATRIRNAALVAAESVRARATHDAQVEYSETVTKLRERFDEDVRDAGERLRRATLPAHRAYNAAVIAAETSVAERGADTHLEPRHSPPTV